jgi:transcription elongation factor Elf1
MVHYDPLHHRGQVSPHICPKCGSHRTQVVGRSLDAKTATIRCASCGERSRVEAADRGDGGGEAAA